MAIQYERFEDNIEVAEDDVSTASEDELDTGQQQQQQQRQHYLNYISTLPVKQRKKLVFEGRWPKGIGSTQIVVGFILTILGETYFCLTDSKLWLGKHIFSIKFARSL